MFSTCLPRFDTLAPRPPTPPRDLAAALDQAVEFLDDSHEVDRVLKGTPTNSSSSPKTACTPDRAGLVANQADADSANPTKRVDFSPWPVFHEHGLPGLLSSPTSNTEKNTPSARDAKPIRSILKQSLGPLPPTPEELESTLNYFSPQEPGSFLKMLQSVINQLSSARQDQRLDAYLTLNGVLRAHEGIPDPQSMASRMGLLMQFISRDMVCKNATGNLDTNIVVQALNLASSIMYNAQLAVNLDDDFKTNLLDRSIHILEQSGIPKQVMKLHIHILAHQNFHAGILTPGKADRMVIALRNMEDRCTGNTAIAMRLDIYKRLLVQAPKVMLTRVREWLNHGFYGMLSPSNEIRGKAIDTMHFAGLTLGTEPPASKAIRDMFDSELKDGKTFFEYFVAQMEQMIADKEIGPCVPQMWSIVIFFFRNRRAPLEKWPKFKSWLMIIQRCLNSSDLSIRRQAMLSWNKLISAVLPDQTTSRNFFAMLRVPIAGGLEKRGNDSHARQFRQSAHESFLYLLYYALRPGLSLPELDSAWDVYVAPTLIDMIKTSKTGVTTACQILLNLLSIKATGWNINVTSRATALTMDELPRLEPRWTRSRAAKLVHILEPIISQTLCDVSEDAILLDAVLAEWLGAIAEAGAHEIKMSNDLKEAIAVLTNLLQRLWQSKMQTSAAADLRIFCQRFLALVDIIITTIGPGPLSEDILSKNSESGAEVAFTPSSRHPKQQGEPHSSLSVLFGCLYRTTSAAMELSVVDSYVSIADGLLRHIVSVRPSGSKKIELLQRLLQLAHDSNSSNTAAAPSMWCAVARSAEAILQTPHELPESGDSQNLGLELRNATSILSTGLSYANDHSACMTLVLQLQDAMSTAAKTGAGSGGVVMAVIEPLSKLLIEDRNVFVENKILLATSIIKTAGWPRNRHELDQSRKQLWGAGLPAQRSAVFDPYEHFYRLICSCMLQMYESFESSTLRTNLFSELLEALTGLLERCPSDILSVSLRKVQDGIAIWIHDSDRKTATARVQAELILSAWKRVLHLVETHTHKDSNLVRALEALFVAGFSSPRKAIVNETILFWNRSFESVDTLEYPTNLEKVLRVRLQEAEITVPGFPESHDELNLPSLPAFFESQNEPESSPSRPNNAHELSPGASLAARALPVSPLLKPMQISTTHANNLSSPPKDGITPSKKLRHEDSQIQFEPIDSSPVRYEESQLLTEHQKEIMARQHDNAHMFADLSSSPVKPTSPRRSVQKKLDFTSDRSSRVKAITTPSRDQNADVPPSDDMPSSPTPSSTRAGNSKFLNLEDMAVDDENDDPPSSPPRAREEDLDDTTIVATDALDDDDMDGDPYTDDPQQRPEGLNPACVEPAPVTLSSSVPTIAEPGPSAEAEVSVERIEETDHSTRVAAPESCDAPIVGQVGGLGLDDADLSRVQNSFPESSSKSEQPVDNTRDKTPGSTSKRKRASGGFSSARKRLSTLSRMASFLWGSQDRNNDDEDSDVGEDIVVASSQVASSPPARPAVHVVVPLQSNSAPTVIEDAVESPKAVATEPTNARRRRGRKDTAAHAAAHASSQPQPRVTRSLKRRASSMDPGPAAGGKEEPNNGDDSTPTPAKIRRSSRVIQKQSTVETAGVETEAPAEHPEKAPELVSSTTNILSATPKRDTSTVASVETIVSPLADRAILTPRRMLARLREVLVDLPKVVLGKDDEREFDDVLYQVRTQMHRAATRGEAQEAAASIDGNGASGAQ